MPKSSQSFSSKVKGWIEDLMKTKIFTFDGQIVYCQPCGKRITCDRKSQLEQHVKSETVKMGNIHVVRPNEALVFTGGSRWPKSRILGGAGCVWDCYAGTKVQRISLALMTLTPFCKDAETYEGVRLNVSGTAQCKVSKDPELLEIAVEQFLGRTPQQIGSAIQLTLEGHLRSILSTLTVEEVYKNRLKFSSMVRYIASADVAKMGIQIVSFNIRDISDDVGYLSSLGKAQTAQVICDARIGVKEANRDASIKESQYEKMAVVAKYESSTRTAHNRWEYQLRKFGFDIDINTAKAKADLAAELQRMKTLQEIRKEELQIKVIEKLKEIEIEEQEVKRKELELKETIELGTDISIQGRRLVGRGNNYHILEVAWGENEKLKMVKIAKAHAYQLVECAKAERRRLRAMIFQGYNHAAICSLVLEALPKIAAGISSPLAKVDEIVILGNRGVSINVLNRLVTKIFPALGAFAGINPTDILDKNAILNYLFIK